jgi:integrase
MTQAFTAAKKAQVGRSRFSGVDLCDAAGFILPPGAQRPVFDQDRWDFREVIGRSVQTPDFEMVMDFSVIDDPRWRLVAKEMVFALMVPSHHLVRVLPRARRIPLGLTSCAKRVRVLHRWFDWLPRHDVTELSQVDEQHCILFVNHQGHRLAGRCIPTERPGTAIRASRAQMILDLVAYDDLFTADRFAPGFQPWKGNNASTVTGHHGTFENKTPPVPNEILQPLLAAALYFVETLGPHIVQLERDRRTAAAVSKRLPTSRRLDPQKLLNVIESHASTGRAFHQVIPAVRQHRIRREGWRPDDPLLDVSIAAIADQAGYREFRGTVLPEIRRALERALAIVGIDKPWGRDAPAVPMAGGTGTVPWTLPLFDQQVIELVQYLRTACLVVVAAVSGMRSGEIMELRRGCRSITTTPAGLTRYKLASKLVKGQPLGGVNDEWVVIEAVHQAIELAEHVAVDWLDHGDPTALIFGRTDMSSGIGYFRGLVNGDFGQRLGLAPIPPGPVTGRMLRRTLAIELAYRPGGLLATKTHLKHISVATAEGYAARPGGAQARLLADVAKEERERNLLLLEQAYADHQRGVQPAGPGARELLRFFATVDDHTGTNAGAPAVRSEQAVRNLLTKRAETLHLGTANYCWFADPAKALCLKLAGTSTSNQPLINMCDSTRCPQATHHQVHRPIWDDKAKVLRTFIGGIGKRQATERDRLTAELARAERVLAEIDAAGAGPS